MRVLMMHKDSVTCWNVEINKGGGEVIENIMASFGLICFIAGFYWVYRGIKARVQTRKKLKR